ncbi:MAG: efflux RND transporter periplasmic adaptor subunit [Candidatus Latescibacterota bacterium]|nr:efflux RND transporter periplasmic adaptor subunit [Candidatus Latescibacterota bacterium]
MPPTAAPPLPGIRVFIRTALLALVAARGDSEAQDFPPSPVVVAKVIEQQPVDQVALVGTVQPRRSTKIASETDGKVIARLKEGGQTVRRGEPVFHLNNDQLRASLVEALADVKLRRFRHKQSVELLQQEAISEDQALEAEYELERARSKLQDLQARLEDLTIGSPLDGLVVQTLVEIGEWVSRGDGVAHIISTDTVRTYVNVPERYVSRLQLGDDAAVFLDALGTDSTQARIVAVLAQGFEESRTFPVVVEFLNPKGDIRAGMSAKVRFTIRSENASFMVHKDAIVSGPMGTYLFVVDGEGTARMRLVQTGLAYQGRVSVQGPLAAGDLAIVRGNERLVDGQKVRVVRKLQ